MTLQTNILINQAEQLFPPNYSLKQLIEANKQDEVCEKHGRKIDLVDISKEIRGCSLCVKGGDIESLEEIIVEIRGKKRRL